VAACSCDHSLLHWARLVRVPTRYIPTLVIQLLLLKRDVLVSAITVIAPMSRNRVCTALHGMIGAAWRGNMLLGLSNFILVTQRIKTDTVEENACMHRTGCGHLCHVRRQN
jgi:hypothetical protein